MLGIFFSSENQYSPWSLIGMFPNVQWKWSFHFHMDYAQWRLYVRCSGHLYLSLYHITFTSSPMSYLLAPCLILCLPIFVSVTHFPLTLSPPPPPSPTPTPVHSVASGSITASAGHALGLMLRLALGISTDASGLPSHALACHVWHLNSISCEQVRHSLFKSPSAPLRQ